MILETDLAAKSAPQSSSEVDEYGMALHGFHLPVGSLTGSISECEVMCNEV